MATVHCYPVDDLVEHNTDSEDCACGPDVEAVFRDDGSNGWLISHHSLDGREQRESGA
jgi:hypothetical protein